MFRLGWHLASSLHQLFRYAPSNLLLGYLHTRRGLKWAAPAMLLGVVYLFAAALCVRLLAGGAPGWVNVLVVVFAWNAFKFLANGPVSLVRLAAIRIGERRVARHPRLDHRDIGVGGLRGWS